MSKTIEVAAKIFQVIRKAGLAGRSDVRQDRVYSAPLRTLIDVSTEIGELTSPALLTRSQNLYSHAASLSLGGGRDWCSGLTCRLRRARELAQFALLYSDRVYIDNFLAGYETRVDSSEPDDDALLRALFLDDLKVLYELKPSLEAGTVVPFSRPVGLCTHCLASAHLGDDGRQRIDRLTRSLDRTHATQVGASLEFDDEFVFRFTGPELLIDHRSFCITQESPPEGLSEFPRLFEQVMSGKEISLSRQVRKKLGVDRMLSDRVIENIAFELTVAQSLGTTFLTDRELHISALAELGGGTELTKRNAIIRQHLTTIVPFVDDVPFEELMRIRQGEAEAFVAYRNALNRAVDQYRDLATIFTHQSARQLYSDVIEPSISRLNARVAGARRTALKSAALSAVSWVGAISFGMYTGFVPTDLVKAAAALGMTKVLADLTTTALAARDAKTSICDEDFYFLWKVKKRAKRSGRT